VSPELFQKTLAAMTPEERKAFIEKLAASMVQPKRTPCDYSDLSDGFVEGDDGPV